MDEHKIPMMVGNYPRVAVHRGYELLDIYHKLSHEDLVPIISFWQRHRALPEGLSSGELIRRASQVVLAVVFEGEIVALSSAFIAHARGDGELYYFYRKFVAQEHRACLLWQAMMVESYRILKAREVESDSELLPRKPQGVLVVSDNPKLARRSVLRAVNETGFYMVDTLSNGNPVYGRRFDESLSGNLAQPERATD